jgi:hypothetical protein
LNHSTGRAASRAGIDGGRSAFRRHLRPGRHGNPGAAAGSDGTLDPDESERIAFAPKDQPIVRAED